MRAPQRNTPTWHQTLAAVLEWSESRLAEDSAQRSPGSRSLRIVHRRGRRWCPRLARCRRALRALVDRSLVRIDRAGSGTRYSLLQTVREFAAERMSSARQAHDLPRRHAERFLEVAEHADRRLRGSEENEGRARFETALADLRVAHQWARANDPALAGRLSVALQLYAYRGLVDEQLVWAELALPLVSETDPARPVLLVAVATRTMNRGDLAEACRIAQQAYALAQSDTAAISALEVLSDACLYAGRLDESRTAAEEVARRAEALGDMHWYVLGRINAALARRYGAEAIGPKSSSTCRPAGRPEPDDVRLIAYTQGSLSAIPIRHRSRPFREAIDQRGRSPALFRGVRSRRHPRAARAGDMPPRSRNLPKRSHTGLAWPTTRTSSLTLRNLAVLFQRAGAAGEAAELLGALERDDSTYGDEADRSLRCGSGRVRNSVTTRHGSI